MDGTPLPAPPVGDPFVPVDADLERLTWLPIGDQPEVFDRIHATLAAILATTSGDGGSSGGGR